MHSIPETEHDAAAMFQTGDPVVIVDRKARKYLRFLAAEKRFNLRGGFFNGSDIIGRPPGCRIQTSLGETVTVMPATIDEYVLLMPRGAAIIPPKDIAYMVHWGDIFPGAVVVEGGIGSGALAIGILRAVGPAGKLISFELREDFASRAHRNIAAWQENLVERLEIRLGNIHEQLGSLEGIDRVMLDVPEPWEAVPGARQALRPGGILIAYIPTIRQIDRLTICLLDQADHFSPPEVVEIINRPWVADRIRLRPQLIIPGHSGFILRTRRVAPPPEPHAPPPAPPIV